MPDNMAVVAEDEISLGFKLAGIKETYNDASHLKKLMDRGDIGIILITKRIFHQLDENTMEKVQFSVRPAVIVLDESEEVLRNLTKVALGVEM